jgi:hypothetical protein
MGCLVTDQWTTCFQHQKLDYLLQKLSVSFLKSTLLSGFHGLHVNNMELC